MIVYATVTDKQVEFSSVAALLWGMEFTSAADRLAFVDSVSSVVRWQARRSGRWQLAFDYEIAFAVVRGANSLMYRVFPIPALYNFAEAQIYVELEYGRYDTLSLWLDYHDAVASITGQKKDDVRRQNNEKRRTRNGSLPSVKELADKLKKNPLLWDAEAGEWDVSPDYKMTDYHAWHAMTGLYEDPTDYIKRLDKEEE